MDLICLCCLAEGEFTYTLESTCELRSEEGDDDMVSPSIRFSEIYLQFMQLPALSNGLDASACQPMCKLLCSQCAAMLKNFYMFRSKALKSYEELQTKARIATIICHLEKSSVGSVVSEKNDENIGQEIAVQNKDDGPFRCKICEKTFKMRKLLLRHEEIHLEEKQYHCQYCNKSFVAKVSCYNHELTVHGRRKKSKKANNIKTKRKNQRNLISRANSRSTSQPSDISKNETKPDKKQYTCDLCPKIFTRQSSLNDHKTVFHAGIRQYSCHICNRAFGKENSLKTHLSLHLGKNYRCKLCGKAFAKVSFLRKHLEDHMSPEGVRRYECSVCSKRFTVKSHLTDHERIHSDKRPYKCNVCGDCFRQKQQLKVHNYQHIGKPFRCKECNAEYGSRSRLQAHLEKYHREIERSIEASTIVQPDFGDKVVNEDILNEICYQIDSNPIILQNIEADGVNFICNDSDQVVLFGEDEFSLLPDMIEPCL